MKLSNAIWRALLVFASVCTIQMVAGMLMLSGVKTPASPHIMEWMLLSNSLVVAALSVVAYRSDLRGWRLGTALAAVPLVIAGLNVIEGVVFLTNSPIQWSRIFGFSLVSAALVIPVWALLFGRRPDL